MGFELGFWFGILLLSMLCLYGLSLMIIEAYFARKTKHQLNLVNLLEEEREGNDDAKKDSREQ